MYEQYWNLKKTPFLNAYDPRNIFLSEQFREGVARLYYLIAQERVAGLLIGHFGCGKSFMLANLAERVEKDKIPVIRIDAIPEGHLAFLRHILAGFGVKEDVSSIADGLMTLQNLCQKSDSSIVRHAILIDEAQYLADDQGLYLVHYLCNLRLRGRDGVQKPLCTIIMAGIPELQEKVRAYQSLQARVQLSWRLDSLDYSQTVEFVQSRMMAAGGDQWIFTEDSLKELYRLTGGLPRNITNVCDTALMIGFAAQAPRVTPELVDQAAVDVGVAVCDNT